MFDVFLKYFKNESTIANTELKTKTSNGYEVQFFKLYIDWHIFIVYAATTDEKAGDAVGGILYHIIGMGDDKNKRSVFFLNETTKKLFTQEELIRLNSISNSPLLNFEDLKNAIRKTMDGSAPEKYIHEIPDAESIDTIRNHPDSKEFAKFFFSKNPEEDIIQDVVDAIDDYSHVLMYDGTITFDLVGTRGKWSNNIAVAFLSSIFQPEFPFYDFKSEKDKYASEILRHIKRIKEDKLSLIYKYRTIPDAIQGHDYVTIDFLDTPKNPRTITVNSSVFKCIKAGYNWSGEKDIYMSITNKMAGTDTLRKLDKETLGIMDEAYPRYWLPWSSILCIRTEKQILWHFNDAFS